MKKAVITILGIQNANYDDNGDPHVRDYSHKAAYYFENSDEKLIYYYNTLPMLIEKFSDDYDIVPIYTLDSKNFNKEVLKNAELKVVFDDEKSLIEETEYFKIFKKIDTLIDSYDEVIADLTHGFRHIPILSIIDLVIQNFNSPNKIDKILFAKEIVKHTPKDKGEYEIIDLKEYLDIANISFVLASFENNYTISNHIRTKDKDFQQLIDMLSTFSENIMANSLINLFQDENSLVERMYLAIENIKKHPKVEPILNKLNDIQNHLNLFIELKEKEKFEQLYELAKIVNKKGYYLNAITLLDEAIGWYCAKSLCQYNKDFNAKYKKLIKTDSFQITSNAKNILKFTFNSRNFDNKLGIQDIASLQKQLFLIDDCKKFTNNLLNEVSKNRNNLAHANNKDKLNEIKKSLEKLFGRFYSYCIVKDVLEKKESSIEDLAKSLNN